MSVIQQSPHQVLAEQDAPLPGDRFLKLLDDYRAGFWESQQQQANRNSHYPLTDDVRILRAWLYRQAHVEYLAGIEPMRIAEASPWEEIKLDYIRQAQDEMRHYKLVRAYLEGLGDKYDLEEWVPDHAEWQQLLSLIVNVDHRHFLDPAKEVIAKATILNYGTEGWSFLTVHPIFIKQMRDTRPDLAELFEDEIAPDEAFHFEIGCKVLHDYCNTLEYQRFALKMLDRQLETHGRLVASLPGWMERAQATFSASPSA